jgi:hypothetical protein
MNKLQKIVLGVIIVLAIFFRFYQITKMPGGLFPDEAANGLDINSMQQGHLQPFYERGNGREALFFYMEWASVAVFGKGPWQHHVVSSGMGVLAVIACFLLTRKLFGVNFGGVDEESVLDLEKQEKKKQRAIWIALLASFLMAVSSWHTVLSRTAFRATLIPFFAAMTFYFLVCTYEAVTQKKKILFAILTGATFALGFYTYIAYRIMAPILCMVILWPIFASFRRRQFRETVKTYWKPAALFIVAFIVVIYPIAKYFYQHTGSFVGRAGQVSVFNPTLYTINGETFMGTPTISQVIPVVTEVFKTQLMGFFTHGDLNWRQNISGFPFLSQLVSPFFGVGLIAVVLLGVWYFFAPVKRSSYWKFFLLTGWLFGMILPVATTAEGIPHGLRGIGVIPPLFIISAWVLYEFGHWVMRIHNNLWSHHSVINDRTVAEAMGLHITPISPVQDATGEKTNRQQIVLLGFKMVVVCFCLALVIQTYFLYFVYAANSPENFYSFRSDLTPVSCYLIYYGDKTNTYLVLDKFSVQTPDYITEVDGSHPQNPRNTPYMQADPENSWELPKLKPGDQVVFTQSSIFDTKKFKQYHPEVSLAFEMRNKFGQAVLAVYGVPSSSAQSFKKTPFDYSGSNLKITGQCQRLFGPNIQLY